MLRFEPRPTQLPSPRRTPSLPTLLPALSRFRLKRIYSFVLFFPQKCTQALEALIIVSSTTSLKKTISQQTPKNQKHQETQEPSWLISHFLTLPVTYRAFTCVRHSSVCGAHNLLIESALQQWERGTVITPFLQKSWLLAQSLPANKRRSQLSFGPRQSGSRVCAFHHRARPRFHDLTRPVMGDQGRITPPKVCSQSPVPRTLGPRIRSMPPGERQYSPTPFY